MSEQVWERRECVSADVEDSLVLLDLDTLVYHSLNKTASHVWRMLNEPRSTDELVAGLCPQYDVTPERCRASVERLLGQFEAQKLVVLKDGAGAQA